MNNNYFNISIKIVIIARHFFLQLDDFDNYSMTFIDRRQKAKHHISKMSTINEIVTLGYVS